MMVKVWVQTRPAPERDDGSPCGGKKTPIFWDESGFRADTVHGKTWGLRGHTPIVQRPGQRQSINAASAVNAKGAFWFCTYEGALTAALFIALLKRMMQDRQRPVHLVVDGLPAHKTALVKPYVASTEGRLTLCRSCPAMRRT